MRHSTRTRLVLAGLAVPLTLVAATVPAQSTTTAAARPSPQYEHVVMIVVDQLRPEFIEAFDMDNVRSLMDDGTNYRNAYLGHMAAETVVSHNVMTSGQLPKHMGWSDEWYRDSAGVLGPVDGKYVTGSMTAGQFDMLINAGGYPKLSDYLHAAFPGKTVAAVGQKSYAVNTFGGPTADMRITYSSRNFDCDGDAVLDNTWRGPSGTNVPEYLSSPVCGRYYIESDKTQSHGTAGTSPAWMYPLEGNRDVPGDDPDHYGGDVWTADAAIDIMENEDWSGLLVTLGGVDKAGHMWGGLNDVRPYPGGEAMSHIADMAKTADEQVGKIIDELDDTGVLDETLVVLTADHAQQSAVQHYGIDGAGRGNFNWYYGSSSVPPEAYLSPQPEIQKLIDETDENVEMSMQDSAIRTWLLDRSPAAMRQAADVMGTLEGVRASYFREGDRYRLRWQAPRSAFGAAEWKWYREHAQEIVNTAAAPYGPDVIGLLANDTSYGVKGDHGGAQEAVQRIPIAFQGAGVKAGRVPDTALRSVDILPTVLREMGIKQTARMDGRGYPLP